MADNLTISDNGTEDFCRKEVPYASQLFHDMPPWAAGLVSVFCICVGVTFAVYIEEIIFFLRNFTHKQQLKRTIWILAFFPGFAATSLIAVLVPRAGTVCDLVSNVFFSTCLYQFLGLMEDYLGGPQAMWSVVGESRQITLSTLPCCCCCRCLPKPTLSRSIYQRLAIVIGQVTIIRPILGFIAVVLLANGSYVPGNMMPTNAFLYMTALNLISTLFAMWGLMVLKSAFRPELGKRFLLNGKFACIQLSLICISLTNIITGILGTTNVIKCSSFYPTKARGEAISHGVIVCLMCLFAFFGQLVFRRKSDATVFGDEKAGKDGQNLNDPNANVSDSNTADKTEDTVSAPAASTPL